MAPAENHFLVTTPAETHEQDHRTAVYFQCERDRCPSNTPDEEANLRILRLLSCLRSKFDDCEDLAIAYFVHQSRLSAGSGPVRLVYAKPDAPAVAAPSAGALFEMRPRQSIRAPAGPMEMGQSYPTVLQHCLAIIKGSSIGPGR